MLQIGTEVSGQMCDVSLGRGVIVDVRQEEPVYVFRNDDGTYPLYSHEVR